MNRFTLSSMTQENIRFKVQIGNYSKYVCKGYYTSPEFSDQYESEWSLLICVYDGADHENFIDVRLKRDNYVIEEQYVNVKMSIVNCFGWNVLKNEKKVLFGGYNEAQVLSVAKAQLKGYFGLKKFFYLPNDTLTLQCDLIVHARNVSCYKKERFSSHFSPDKGSFSECFTHSRLVNDGYDFFVWEIHDFSVHSYGGRSVSPEYQCENLAGKWSLAVYNMTDDYYGESLDIRLARRESYEHQMVKAKLAIVDRSGNVLKYNEKNIYFTSPREIQMLSLTDKDMSGWFGLKKKQLMPDDKLTLRCEIHSYTQADDNFGRKADFDKSVKAFGYTPMKVIPYLVAICFLLPVVLHVFYMLWLAMLLFFWNMVQYVLEIIINFVSDVIEAIQYFGSAVVGFIWIKDWAEEIKREKAKELKRKIQRQKMKALNSKYLEYNTGNYARNELYYYKVPKYTNTKYLKY